MTKIISQVAVLTGFLLAFSGCHLIPKSQAASEASPKPEKRTVASPSLSEGLPCNKSNYEDFIFTPGVHNCDLREVDFSGKDLSQTNLSWANIEGANFSGVNLNLANLEGVKKFGGAIFDMATTMVGTIVSDELREYARSQGALVDVIPLRPVNIPLRKKPQGWRD